LALGTALMDDGIAPDPESAERWLTFAAERGEDLAWAGLGELYENGALDGVPDHQTAREMYERGADEQPEALQAEGVQHAGKYSARDQGRRYGDQEQHPTTLAR
jgi:TPR repeat protein